MSSISYLDYFSKKLQLKAADANKPAIGGALFQEKLVISCCLSLNLYLYISVRWTHRHLSLFWYQNTRILLPTIPPANHHIHPRPWTQCSDSKSEILFRVSIGRENHICHPLIPSELQRAWCVDYLSGVQIHTRFALPSILLEFFRAIAHENEH